jgi:hypothetical protein
MYRTTTFAGSQATSTCADCGAPAGGNFCSSCGVDLRADASSILGSARRPFPVVYLQLLRSPIMRTVAFAEDKTYREHLSFLLTAIGIFCLLFLPTLFAAAAAAGPEAHVMFKIVKRLDPEEECNDLPEKPKRHALAGIQPIGGALRAL